MNDLAEDCLHELMSCALRSLLSSRPALRPRRDTIHWYTKDERHLSFATKPHLHLAIHTLSSTQCHTYTSSSGIWVCLCQLSCSCAIGDEPLILEQWSCDGRPSTEILGAHEEVRSYRQHSVPMADLFSVIIMNYS